MRVLDLFKSAGRARQGAKELANWQERAKAYYSQAEERRQSVCETALNQVCGNLGQNPPEYLQQEAIQLCQTLLSFEGHFYLPVVSPVRPNQLAEEWKQTAAIKQALALFEDTRQEELLIAVLAQLLQYFLQGVPLSPDQSGGEWASLSVPLYTFLPNPAAAISASYRLFFSDALEQAELFSNLRRQLERNLLLASGIDPFQPEGSRKQLILPEEADLSPEELVQAYLSGTPLADFLLTPLPFAIPAKARFEHMHIVGGSGHGKTQLLQHLILHDLAELKAGRGSIIVIDSQGDMIRNILTLSELAYLTERLIFINPTDIEYPPALNLLDFGLNRLTRYSLVEREKLVNGAIALYEYLFGALLGAELTQRQGVIFRFLARLILTVPQATIHTLMQFMEEPDSTRPYLSQLDSVSRRFFETQFFSKAFDDTRQQILTRLWGVVSNSVLERMFGSSRNKVDLFDAMNRGSLILINTAKDLLKQEGCEILGRFFIALIAQATQERASTPQDLRRATFLYIDEAHDYFDESLESLLNQARKYSVGLILAHQNLDQFETSLRSTVAASTSIKVVGGLSAKDAGFFAKDMRTTPEFLQSMRKSEAQTEFACFVRNFTPQPIRLRVPLGEMERRPKISEAQLRVLLEVNRERYCSKVGESQAEQPSPGKGSQANTEGLDEPDLL